MRVIIDPRFMRKKAGVLLMEVEMRIEKCEISLTKYPNSDRLESKKTIGIRVIALIAKGQSLRVYLLRTVSRNRRCIVESTQILCKLTPSEFVVRRFTLPNLVKLSMRGVWEFPAHS